MIKVEYQRLKEAATLDTDAAIKQLPIYLEHRKATAKKILESEDAKEISQLWYVLRGYERDIKTLLSLPRQPFLM